MICLGYNAATGVACNGEQFLPGERMMTQYWRGKRLRFVTPVMICIKCDWFTVGMDQVEELRKRTKKEYARSTSKRLAV